MPQVIYLTLFILGIVLQYAQFIPFLMEHGFNVSLFLEQLFTNQISSFFGIDVIISALVVLTFIAYEGTRLSMKYLWIYWVGTLLGVAVGLPLFLLMRQRHLEATTQPD